MSEIIGNPESNRPNIEKMKEVVNKSGVLLMENGEDKDDTASRVLKEALDIKGVDDIRDLLAATDNRNINQQAIQNKINNFGVAVAECIQGLGDESSELKGALVAGSFSLKEKLPETWSIEITDQSGNDVSLATVIYDASIVSPNRATQMAIIQETEWIDYCVTHKQDGVTLNEELNNAIRELDAMGKKSFNNNERAVIRQKLDYLKGLKTNFHSEGNQKDTSSGEKDYLSVDYEPPVYNKDSGEWEGGSKWELSPEFTAEAMKYMDHAMRWTSYTPPEWFKELPSSLQAKLEYMVAVNGAAANLMYAKKDLDKVMSNDAVFGFTHEQLNALFDDDFKWVYSKMLNDFCEIGLKTTDQNGIQTLRYKEKYYAFDYKAKDGDGAFLDGNDSGRKIIPETPDNLGKGVRTIDVNVFNMIKNIKGYEDNLALVFANYKQKEADRMGIVVGKGIWETYKKNVYRDGKIIHRKGDFVLDDDGNKKAGYLCKMNAYTAYNFFFAMGDSSLADRKRILPTFNGVISDAIRTLNPEYKARAKWQVEKSGQARHLSKKDFLLESEYFGGPVGRYILTVAKLERDIGRPISGDKTIMEKIYDGEINPFPDKTYLGFGDFFNTSRDLEFTSKDRSFDKDFSFNELIYKYGKYDSEGNFIKNDSNPDFRFKSQSSTTFENEFFDSLDAAVFTGRCIMGKEKVEDLGEFGAKIMGAFGMVNGIKIGTGENQIRPFSYTRSPEVIRSILVGVFGADFGRLSSEYIPIVKKLGKEKVEINYDLFVYDVLTSNRMGMGLNANEINLNKVMRLLGVKIEPGKMPNSNVFRAMSAGRRERLERDRTYELLQEQKRLSYKGETTKGMTSLISVFDSIKGKSVDEDYKRMVNSFERAIDFGDLSYAKRLLETMKKF